MVPLAVTLYPYRTPRPGAPLGDIAAVALQGISIMVDMHDVIFLAGVLGGFFRKICVCVCLCLYV